MSAKTSLGMRRMDWLAQHGEVLKNIESKGNNAVRTASQVQKDEEMAVSGATLVGKNAPPELRGKHVKIVTEVRRKRVPDEQPTQGN